MSNKTIKLESGEWPFDEVLPTHWAEFSRYGPSAPPRPYREVEIDGGTEKLDLPDDHPLMVAFYAAVADFNRECHDFEMLAAFSRVNVPEDWALPEGDALALNLCDNMPSSPRERKLLYINYRIITTKEEKEFVERAADGLITSEERAAGAIKFPDTPGDSEGTLDPAGADSSGSEQAVGSAGE